MHKSFALASSAAADPLYSREVRRVVEGLVEGSSLSEALQRNPTLFPPMFTQTVTVGEETGKLAKCLDSLGDLFGLEVDQTVDTLAATLEPILLGLCSLIAGLFIVATILPLQEFMSRLL